MAGFFGPRLGGWHRPRFQTIHTGILCPFCREDQLIVIEDHSMEDGMRERYWLFCGNNPRQGAVCPWLERTRGDGVEITVVHMLQFRANVGNLSAMIELVRIALPELGRVPLEAIEPGTGYGRPQP